MVYGFVLYTGRVEVKEAGHLDGCYHQYHSCNLLGNRRNIAPDTRTCWLRETESSNISYRAHDDNI